MAISDTQKLDYLWKKVGYGVTKTDTEASGKLATNESTPSPALLRGDKVWQGSSSIPATIPGSSSGVVTLYSTSSPVEATVDSNASANRTWKTSLTDWIPPEFGSTYLVKVYIHTAASAATAAASGTQVFGAGSGNSDEWFFDYQSGVINFIGTSLPNGISFTGKSVYISGARYSGAFGVGTSNGVNTVTFNAALANTNSYIDSKLTKTNPSISGTLTVGGTASLTSLILTNVLGTQYGGTGLSTFTSNGVMISTGVSTLAFVTGTSGKVLQISANGSPIFDALDCGLYT